MRQYELVFVMRPSVKDVDKKKLIDSVKTWLEKVKITKEDDWGQKPLAYTIKHEIAGNYYLLEFESEEAVPADLERKLHAREDVIRHLLVRKN